MPDPETLTPISGEQPPQIGPEQYAGEDEPGPDANRIVEASAEGVGETAVPAKAEDTRWDIDKARTVGIAAKESDDVSREYGGPLDDRAFDNEHLNEERRRNESQKEIGHLMEVNHRDEVDRLRWAKRKIQKT